MQRFVLLFGVFFIFSIAGYGQSNSREILEKIVNDNPCEIKEKADLLLNSFIGDNIYDSLYIYRTLGIKVFMCDHKSSNKYFNYTLDLALKAKLYDIVKYLTLE